MKYDRMIPAWMTIVFKLWRLILQHFNSRWRWLWNYVSQMEMRTFVTAAGLNWSWKAVLCFWAAILSGSFHQVSRLSFQSPRKSLIPVLFACSISEILPSRTSETGTSVSASALRQESLYCQSVLWGSVNWGWEYHVIVIKPVCCGEHRLLNSWILSNSKRASFWEDYLITRLQQFSWDSIAYLYLNASNLDCMISSWLQEPKMKSSGGQQ